MPQTLNEIADRLAASGLLSVGEIATLLAGVPGGRPQTAEEFIQTLTNRGALTGYQAECILSGRIDHLVLGNYVVLDKLGQGGMGLVLKARHRRMDRVVALKVLSPDSIRTPTMIERFQREVRAAAKLSHPNIVTAHDADEHHGTHFLVMEFVEGRDLSSIVKEHGPFSVPSAVDCIVQAAVGLEYAHQQGVVHRDIKPGNLILAEGQTLRGERNHNDESDRPSSLSPRPTALIKILDMGLARIESASGAVVDRELTTTGSVLGTIDYMSPEQALDTKLADARSDIYSLGCSLFYLLTGQTMYPGDTVMRRLLAHRESPIPDLSAQRPDITSAVQIAFSKMVAKQPNDRFQTMTEVIQSFVDLQRGLGPASDRELLASLCRPSASKSAGTSTSRILGVPPSAQSSSLAETVLLKTESTTQCSHHASDRSWTRWIMGGAAVAFVLIGAWIWQTRSGAATNPTRELSVPLETTHTPEQTQSREKKPPGPAIAPFTLQQAKAHQVAWVDFLDTTAEWTNSTEMKLVLIPPGVFLMGSTPSQVLDAIQSAKSSGKTWGYTAISDEAPQHRVELSRPMWVGATEVTIGQFEMFVRETNYLTDGERFGGGSSVLLNETDPAKKSINWRSPGYSVSNDSAVCQVTWNDAIQFCNWLSTREQLQPYYGQTPTGDWESFIEADGYRLPTEAEWEFACRAGTTTSYYFGESRKPHSEFATDRGGKVASAPPNPFGLFDMSGSVEEWCQDWWSGTYYSESPASDPTGPASQTPTRGRVVRGGTWSDFPHMWRSTYRRDSEPMRRTTMIGFRVVRRAIATTPIAKILDPDRRVAEWVLDRHGSVRLDGQDREYLTAAELPNRSFKTTLIQFLDLRAGLDDDSLKNLIGLDSLKRLTLYDNRRVTDVGIAHLEELPNLEYLDLRDTRMTDEGLKHFAAMNRLESLVLEGSQFTDNGVEHLEGCLQLRALQLRLPQMTDQGLQKIQGLSRRLRILQIGGSRVSDAGLAQLAELQSLEQLGLNNLAISDDGLKQLQGLKTLYVLNLSRTPISDAGLVHLRGLANLRDLVLSESRVTQAGVADLQTALPKCVIRF